MTVSCDFGSLLGGKFELNPHLQPFFDTSWCLASHRMGQTESFIPSRGFCVTWLIDDPSIPSRDVFLKEDQTPKSRFSPGIGTKFQIWSDAH